MSARLTAAKQTPERAWLGAVSSVVLQQALADLNAAYRNFFALVTGKRKGPKIAPPRLRSRKDRRQVTPLPLPDTARECGIDLGLGHFAVLDDGTKITAPRFLRRGEETQAGTARPVSQAEGKREPGEGPREGRAVARPCSRCAPGLHHKLSTAIIRENQAMTVEDLAVKGLARTRLAKSVHDAGWSAFVGMLEYKAALYGREFAEVGRFEPTSQVCSACGVKDGPKPLHIREWQCAACDAVHDRDINAAKNILALGCRERLNVRGGGVRPGLVLATAGEAGSLRGAA
jgi:putative transposase